MLSGATVDHCWVGVRHAIMSDTGVTLLADDLVEVTDAVMAYLESEGLLK